MLRNLAGPMNSRLTPEDPEYPHFYRWWLSNGKPRQFNKNGYQYIALTDNDQIIFIIERSTGIDNGTSFDGIH